MRARTTLACLAFCASAQAEYWSGNVLRQALDEDAAISARGNRATPDQGHAAGSAMGFVIGVHDVIRGVTVCTPPGVTVSQLMDIVRAYLRGVPHRLHETAESLVQEALTRVFPCEQRQRQGRERGA